MDSRQDGTESASSWLPNFLRKSTDSKTQGPDERSSLLPKPDNEPTIGSVDDFEDEGKSKTQLILHEFWVLLNGSIPVFLAYMLQNSLQTVSVL
ncbi:hypothetical protein KCU79_g18532, partial [Aureobasidium melanogenum]